MGAKIIFIPKLNVTKDYAPDTIDAAIIATLKMLFRGKAVVWQGARMYTAGGTTCINGKPVGDMVSATFVWFTQYSTADPYKSHWGESSSSVEFLRRRFT